MTERTITANNVQPASDGTTATEFEYRQVQVRDKYCLDQSAWRLMPSTGAYAQDVWFVATNPTKPRPDWSPPEWLLPGWVVKMKYSGAWFWSESKPTWLEDDEGWTFTGKCAALNQGIDTSDWPDVEWQESLYECRGRQHGYSQIDGYTTQRKQLSCANCEGNTEHKRPELWRCIVCGEERRGSAGR